MAREVAKAEGAARTAGGAYIENVEAMNALEPRVNRTAAPTHAAPSTRSRDTETSVAVDLAAAAKALRQGAEAQAAAARSQAAAAKTLKDSANAEREANRSRSRPAIGG